ncbi:glycoside hydrolase superfamily [Mycena albidolilacea]|uniref:alpha-amylase n=1 Tax=Mycena albidolilacea TaxID=1033008 RepID=A0AAD7F0T7_9AGAR|nr:glycoside hydrolase superfamily [Mycena albidolilacea]
MLPPFLAVVSALILVSVSPALAASAEDWATRSIYQLLTDRFATSDDSSTPCDTSLHTYCGGSWAGITHHLGYIQDMGFDAVWISPVVKNVDGTAYGDGYHGYWSADMDALSSHFGPAADLKNLSDALHARGMYLMLDVVVNHMASPPNNTNPSVSNPFGIDFSALSPFRKQADFHKQCFIQDFTNQTEVEQCWLGDAKLPLADVNTEDAGVVAALCENIKGLVKTYGVDGVRIDTVKHVRRDFWAGYRACAGVFTLGEVETDDPAYAVRYLGPLDAVLDYPAFYNLTRAFSSTSGDLSRFASVPALPALASSSSPSLSPASASTSASAASSSASPAPLLLTAAFLENHDQPRFPSLTADGALRKNAMVWPFVGDGIPTLYYGQEQGYEGGGDPANREALWLSGYATNKPGVALVTTLNKVRKHAMKANPEFVVTPKWGRCHLIPVLPPTSSPIALLALVFLHRPASFPFPGSFAPFPPLALALPPSLTVPSLLGSLDQPIRRSHPYALQAAPPHPLH